MKKGIIRHNLIHCRKWIVTWIVLILILSLISLTAGSGNNTDNHENAGTDPDSKTVTDKDVQSGKESTGDNLESKEKLDTDKDNQEPDTETLEERAKESNSTDDQENSEKIQKTESDSEDGTYNRENTRDDLKTELDAEKDTGSQESLEESTGTKTETKQDTGDQENLEKNSTKEVESGSTDNKKGSEENLETKTETEQDTDNQEIIEKNPEVQTGEKDDISSQESAEENSETKIKGEKSTENQKNAEEGMENKTEAVDDNEYNGNAGKGIETGVKAEKDADNQEKPENNQETEKVERCSTDNQESACKAPAQKEKIEEKPKSQENSESNLKLKTCPDNKKDISGNPEKKTETKAGSCDGSKNLKTEKGKTETRNEACSVENNLNNNDKEYQIKIDGTNCSYITENKELTPEVKSGKSSWNNLKFILSYPSSLRPFYTTNESVKISYKGSEDLKGQKVDIYLVKTCNSSVSGEPIKNITDGSTISFEDIFSNNPEFYIQIPETLNEGGDLSPLTLGPLPEGSYWVVVTLAENETKASEPEKTILLAHYFKVFEYEMKAVSPHALEEGENFEVDLSLKNAPAQKNYTYWALLIREDAFRTSADISSDTNGTKTISGTFLQGLRLIENFGLNSTGYEPESGKDKLKNEIRAFIGEGNGTISIGEENQNVLSLTTSDLHPGNYILFAGAYEEGKGFTGIAQKEVSINEARKSHGSDNKQESNTDISKESQNSSSMKTEQLVHDTASSLGLEDLEPQIREETIQAAAVVKNPSKLASFVIGFVGTLLIGITILKRRR